MKHLTSVSDATGLPSETVAGLFLKTAQQLPDKTAVISANVDQTVTYNDLLYHAAAWAQTLPKAAAGERVAILMDSKIATITALLACHLRGLVFVPIDARGLSEVSTLLQLIEPAIVLTQGKTVDDALIDGIKTAFPEISLNPVDALPDLDEALASELELPSEMPSLDDPAILLLTSGTTSARKAVVLTHRAFAAPLYSITPLMGYTGDEIEYVCGNLDHAFALGRMRNLLPIGATMVVDDGPFMPQKALAALGQTGATCISAPAAGIILILHRHFDQFAAFSDQLKVIKMASQAVSNADKSLLVQTFANTRVYLNYGLSEAQRSTLLEIHNFPDKLSSSGIPVGGHDVMIRDADTLEVLDAGAVGRICVRGPNLMSGYWRNPEKTEEAFRDGWLVTDDLGELTADGFLIVHGRNDEVINSGGEKFTPDEFENVLRPHLSEQKFVVCAMSDPQGILGDVPVLCVEDPSVTEPCDWKAWKPMRVGLIRQRIGSLPKYAMNVPEIPRTATGKPKRKALTLRLNALQQRADGAK